jgi:RNA polymerase sigma-70 factor (ECF subfamily)
MSRQEEKMTSDVALAAALADDLDTAFETLAQDWGHRLYAFALRMTGSPRDAEDLAEETLVQAWRALLSYPVERRRALRLRPWLFQIAANLARNRARSLRRHDALSLDATSDASADEPSIANVAERLVDDDPLGAPEEALARSQRLADLAALLLTLPESQRVVVILRHVEGLSFAAIAESLGEPIGTVKSHASRGVARLRRAVEREHVAEAQEVVR